MTVDHGTPGRAWTAFDRLGVAARRTLQELAVMRSFERGDAVLVEGAETPVLGSLERGRVALRLRTPELGTRVTIATVEPGELLGWSAIVPPYRTTCDAIATEPILLLTFDAGALRSRLAADGELAAQLLPCALETVAHRLTTSWHQLIDVFEPRGRGPW